MKKYITNVQNATTKALSVWGFVGAGVTSGLLSNVALRILWMLIGALLYGLTTVPPTTVTNVDPGHAVMTKYRSMVARDDKLLNVLLDGSWRRDCGYRVVPWTQLADGSIRQSIIQICEDVEK
jgi:hypothetical protein